MVTTVTKAINAYKKTLQSNANTKPSAGELARSINNFNKAQSNTLQDANALSNAAKVITRAQAEVGAIVTFPQAVSNLMQEHLQKVRQGEKSARQTVTGQARPDEIAIMAAINESEGAFNRIVVLRDKLVSAYQEVMKMPI